MNILMLVIVAAIGIIVGVVFFKDDIGLTPSAALGLCITSPFWILAGLIKPL